MRAVYPDSRNPMAFPELVEAGLHKWTVDWVYLADTDAPDYYEDISAHINDKIAALLCHKSQITVEFGELIRARAQQHGRQAANWGLNNAAFAEPFRRLWTREWGPRVAQQGPIGT